MHRMTKRILAAMLWFYAGWYAGAILADFIGVSPMLGPILGTAVAAVMVGDPRRLIWTDAPGRAAAAPEGLTESN